MREIWKPVRGHRGRYEVSNLGRVRSITRAQRVEPRDDATYFRKHRGRVLRPGRCPSGHVSVVLGRSVGSVHVHVIVLRAFRGPARKGQEGRHLNGKPADNRLNNLEWSTRRRNSQDKKYHNGAGNYKLSPAQVRRIKRALKRGESCSYLGPLFGVTPSMIYNIREGLAHTDIVV